MSALEVFQTWLKDQYAIEFKNDDLLVEALTHSSYMNEHRRTVKVYNERIEFLGDAVLELFVSNWLYRNLPDYKEGQLSRLRAQIVCEESLSKLAKECRLDEYLLLGRGERATGGQDKPAILCDLFEAFTGALYLDKGFEEASRFLTLVIVSKIKNGRYSLVWDYKTELQEYFQQNGAVAIRYQLLQEQGPSHEKVFVVQLSVNDRQFATGSGKTKKAAEQEAAKKTLQALNIID